MKRILTFLLTLVLLVSSASLSSMYVMAASGDSNREVELSKNDDGNVEGSASFDVTGSYVPASDRADVIKVVIKFGASGEGLKKFEYNPGSMTWQPDTLTYRDDTGFSWTSGNSDTVTVENLSNVAITVSASVSQEGVDEFGRKVTVAVDTQPRDLRAAWDGMPRNQAPYTEFFVSVDGKGQHPGKNTEVNEPVKVGTVTLTIKKTVSP